MTMSPSPLAWSLHSPARFIAVLAGCLTLLIGLVALGLRGTESGPERNSEEQRSVAQTHATPSATVTTTEHADDEGESIGAAARRTVERFLKHYLAPTLRQELDQLRPLCTPELWTGLKVADPAKMPRGPIETVEKIADGAFTATFSVSLPDGALAVDVVAAPDGLRVASVEPEMP
jgi:hypothetical protein